MNESLLFGRRLTIVRDIPDLEKFVCPAGATLRSTISPLFFRSSTATVTVNGVLLSNLVDASPDWRRVDFLPQDAVTVTFDTLGEAAGYGSMEVTLPAEPVADVYNAPTPVTVNPFPSHEWECLVIDLTTPRYVGAGLELPLAADVLWLNASNDETAFIYVGFESDGTDAKLIGLGGFILGDQYDDEDRPLYLFNTGQPGVSIRLVACPDVPERRLLLNSAVVTANVLELSPPVGNDPPPTAEITFTALLFNQEAFQSTLIAFAHAMVSNGMGGNGYNQPATGALFDTNDGGGGAWFKYWDNLSNNMRTPGTPSTGGSQNNIWTVPTDTDTVFLTGSFTPNQDSWTFNTPGVVTLSLIVHTGTEGGTDAVQEIIYTADITQEMIDGNNAVELTLNLTSTNPPMAFNEVPGPIVALLDVVEPVT